MSWRLFHLNELHKRIDDALRAEQRSRLPNPFAIMRLKRLKRAIKDRLSRFVRQPRSA